MSSTKKKIIEILSSFDGEMAADRIMDLIEAAQDHPARMKISGGSSIPWEMIMPHDRQALSNHAQSLKTLNSRGGLSPSEALAILDDQKWTESLWRPCREEQEAGLRAAKNELERRRLAFEYTPKKEHDALVEAATAAVTWLHEHSNKEGQDNCRENLLAALPPDVLPEYREGDTP